VACCILEAEREVPPAPGFLHGLQELCRAAGVVLILDEMITGFRWGNGGAQAVHDIVPDLSTFGKALANGFALAALMGKREIMRLGGLDHDRERVFLISTTHGAENHALAAMIATLRVYESEPVIETLYARGERLAAGFRAAVDDHGLGAYVPLMGRPCCLLYGTRDQEGKPSQPFRTLFLQETIRRGILMPQLIVSYSHSEQDIDRTIEAIHGALGIYRKALDEGIGKYLEGRPVQPVYRKFN
jgi:glutamate-1-semialdehyde 2,1-aminomutase